MSYPSKANVASVTVMFADMNVSNVSDGANKSVKYRLYVYRL